MASAVLADAIIQSRLRTLAGQDAELRLIQRSPPEWKATAVAGVCLQDLTLQKSLSANEAGQTVLQHAKRLAERLRALESQAASLQAALGKCRQRAGTRATVEISLKPELERLFPAVEEQATHEGILALRVAVSCSP